MTVFTWEKYFERIAVNPIVHIQNDWNIALKQNDLNVANRLLYTAYMLAENLKRDSFAVSWNEIDTLKLKQPVSSVYFSNNKEDLRRQLTSLGAKLLQRNGENQYIRTIAFYSGVALVKVIRDIADTLNQNNQTLTDYALQYHTPEEIKFELRRYVQNSAQRCLNGFQTEDERNGVLDDICDTLVNLMDLYRECLTNFSVEDLLEVCCLPLSRPAAQKIAELFGQVSQERIKIGVGKNGEGVFKFPVSASLLSSDKKNGNQYDALWIKIVRSTDTTWITYKREGDNWQINYTGGAPDENGYVEVPLIDVKGITRIPVHNGEQCHSGAMDIRPRVCDNRYVLFVEHAGNASIYLPGRKVNKNDVCHVFPTSSIDRLRVVIKDEDGNERDIKSNDVGRIALEGDNLDALIVDDDVYPITCSAEQDWLDKEKRFRYLYRAGSGAYQADVCPVKVDKFPAAREIIYRVGDDEIVLRKKDGLQWNSWVIVPPKFLWKRGKIVVRGDSEELANTKVIFVNVDFGDFDMPSQVDQVLDPTTIQYQDKKGDWVSPTLNYKHGDSLIQFEVENLTIKRFIDRVGVFFITPSGVSISIPPESEDWRNPTPLAERDFEKLSCKVVVPSGNYKVLLINGVKHTELTRVAQERILENGYTTFHWRSYKNALKDDNVGSVDCNENKNYFAVCIRSEDNQQLWIYKFKVINPIKLTYKPKGDLPVHSIHHILKNDGTLVAKHFISYYDALTDDDTHPILLLCCPIERLDYEDGFVALPCERVLCEGVSVAQEKISVPQFGNKFREHLGSGCVCFLAKKQTYDNTDREEYRLISSGFLVRNNANNSIVADSNLISQLREAIVNKNEQLICKMFSSEDEQVRDVVRGVLDRVWKNIVNIHAPEIKDYLNLYRCEIKNEKGQFVERSGYAFLADWYNFGQNQETFHGVSRVLFDEYRKYWPRLMFPVVKEVKSPKSDLTVDQYLKWYLEDGDNQGFKLQCFKLCNRDADPSLQIEGSTFLKLYDAINRRLKFEEFPTEHGHPNCWLCSASIGKCFYSQYYEYRCMKKLNGDIRQCWSSDRNRIQRSPQIARAIMERVPYLYYHGVPLNDQLMCTSDILCGLRKREIREFLKVLARELFEWRKNPTLDDGAQLLKDDLLLLEEIDEQLFSAPPNINDCDANAPCCFTELVELLAFNQFIHSN